MISTGTGIVVSALQVCLCAGGPEHFLKGEIVVLSYRQGLGKRHLSPSTPLKCFLVFSRPILVTVLAPHEGWSYTRPFSLFIPTGFVHAWGSGAVHFQADPYLSYVRQACPVL